MKNKPNFIHSFIKFLTLLFLSAIVVWGCQPTGSNTCDNVTGIEGEYDCSGQCVVTDSTGKKSLITVSVETDNVKRFSDSSKDLYQVEITGADNFHEVEIGALSGLTLRTATAAVSDSLYPVLEEYIFDTDPSCNAVGFTKIVRNPTKKDFKACVIYCKKKT